MMANKNVKTIRKCPIQSGTAAEPIDRAVIRNPAIATRILTAAKSLFARHGAIRNTPIYYTSFWLHETLY